MISNSRKRSEMVERRKHIDSNEPFYAISIRLRNLISLTSLDISFIPWDFAELLLAKTVTMSRESASSGPQRFI